MATTDVLPMAQGRIIDKKISVSEQVANLPVEAQLLFTWMIPHADDFGLLPYSSRSIKALVIPMIDTITSQHVQNYLEAMLREKLIEVIAWEGSKYYRLTGFHNQKLRKDIKPNTIVPGLTEWEDISKITKRIVNETEQVVTDTKRVETDNQEPDEQVKLREEKLITGGEELPPIIPPLAASPPDFSKPLQEIISKKAELLKAKKPPGISIEWQEKAFRYADKLGIKLDNSLKARWLKAFKQSSEGRKAANLETAYRYLIDHPKRYLFGHIGMMKMFFKIYENGLRKKYD